MKTLSLLTSAALLTFTSLSAVETDPVGYVTQTVPAHDGNSSTLSLHSLPLRATKVYTGITTDVVGSDLVVSGADFSGGAFPDLESLDSLGKALYYVEILDGTQEGLKVDISAVNGATLTLSETVDSVLADATSFAINKYWTLGEVFGTTGEDSGLRSFGSISDVDLILTSDDAGNFNRFYLYEAPIFAGGAINWSKVGESATTDMSSARITDDTFLVLRTGVTARDEFTFHNSGEVKLGKARVPVFEGINLVSFSFPVETTLDSSGLQAAGLKASGSIADADIVLMTSGGEFRRFFLYEAPIFAGGGVNWAEVGESTTIDKGAEVLSGPILILRSDLDPLNWDQPQPFTLTSN